MPDPTPITEETTLAKLREQRLLLEVIAIRLYPAIEGWTEDEEGIAGLLEASVHHATGFYTGTGPTEATAIEAAFSKLRQVLSFKPAGPGP